MNSKDALRFIEQRFAQETDPTLKFLAVEQENLEDHVRYTAWAYGKYSRKLTKLEKQYELAKTEYEEFKGAVVKYITEQVNPQTERVYSVEFAGIVYNQHSRVKHLKRVMLDLKYKQLDMKRYLKALELKVTMMPGSQGLRNKEIDAIEVTENEE